MKTAEEFIKCMDQGRYEEAICPFNNKVACMFADADCEVSAVCLACAYKDANPIQSSDQPTTKLV